MEFVYDMTWAEFQIRLFSFKRQEQSKFEMLRELMWTTYISSHLDPKKMAKRKEQFFPLNIDKKRKPAVSEEQKQLFISLYQEWKNNKIN